MAARRKMLGALTDPSVQEMMRLMETQSRKTLAGWAAAQAAAHELPILADCADERPEKAIRAVEACLRGEKTLREIKPLLGEARKAGQERTESAAIQAAARAVGTACSVLLTPTNALGWSFYHAAAQVYASACPEDRAKEDAMASRVLADVLASLRACAVEDEKDPVRMN